MPRWHACHQIRAAGTDQEYTEVSVQEAQEMMEAGATYLDVRQVAAIHWLSQASCILAEVRKSCCLQDP